MEIGIECWAVPAIDLFFSCVWSESEVKSDGKKWSEVIFWFWIFFISWNVNGRVMGNNNISIKSEEQLSYGC